MTEDNRFRMSMNLNVLQHLGINLYSNVPAVLSEVVANSWDADATEVKIEITDDKIVITDDGLGMTKDEINDKYLKVGYQKRENGNAITPKYNRSVMGRKGIGKLSLFSIARKIEVHTVKNGVKNGLKICTEELRRKIQSSESIYYPEAIPTEEVSLNSTGTQIVLTELKKKTSINTKEYLKKRLARRFSIIGSEFNFKIVVNGDEVDVSDRDYFHKLEHMWVYNDDQNNINYQKYCDKEKLKTYEQRENIINGTEFKVNGWIGTVKNAGDLKDEAENINKIVVMVRGKLAQEDILEDFSEGGLYTKYLIGEIHADFLDTDEEEDIATSSRQKIIEDDPRYLKLKEFVHAELKNISKAWSEKRKELGTQEALAIPAIKNWFKELGKDHKSKAKSLFGKINQLELESESKKDLFKHSVLAFESFKLKENLEEFDKISPENLEQLSEVMANFDDIEATLYHQIITERLKVIRVLQQKVDNNDLEKVIQEYIFTHLWLLDPSWDRGTETPIMEQRFTTAFKDINDKLTEEERKGRFDIKYKKASGKHVIIELKRAEVRTDTSTLLSQVSKYSKTMRKILRNTDSTHEPYEIICLLGKELKDWEDEEDRNATEGAFKPHNARIVMYDTLIENAERMYEKFLEKNAEAGRISRLIQEIDLE